MPRQATIQPAESRLPDYDIELMQADANAVTARSQDLQVIDAQYGDNLPYDRTRIENETRFYLAQSAEAMLEAGKRLLLLKEHELHGDFTESLERIGINPRTGRALIQASVKFGNSKRQALAVLGKTKLLELVTESDEDLDELADGGTIAGLHLDEIDRMTTRELKAALREAKAKAKEDGEISERILADKDKKINELDAKLTRREAMPEAEKHAELEKQLSDATQRTLGQTLDLLKAISDIYTDDTTPDHLRGACYHSLMRIRSRLQDIELDYNVNDLAMGGEVLDDIDPTTGKPVWLQDIKTGS